MDVRIADGADFLLAGLAFYGDPFSRNAGWTEENEIGRLWSRFMRYREERPDEFPAVSSFRHPGMSGPTGEIPMLEVHIYDTRTEETGHYEIFVGYPVDAVGNLPAVLSFKHLFSAKTAWFTLSGKAMENDDSYAAMEAWIGANGFVRDGGWTCNVYDGRFKGIDRLDESVIDVCIPVR